MAHVVHVDRTGGGRAEGARAVALQRVRGGGPNLAGFWERHNEPLDGQRLQQVRRQRQGLPRAKGAKSMIISMCASEILLEKQDCACAGFPLGRRWAFNSIDSLIH